MNSKYIFLFITFLFIEACTFTDNVDRTASFMEINTIDVVAANSSQGVVTHDITDVWISVDGDLLGVFPLPAVIPLLASSDSTSIQVTAGIRNNGAINNPIIYPFLRPITYTEKLVPGETISRSPTFTYFENLEIPILETFENGTIFTVDLDEDFDTGIEITDECVRSGLNAAVLKMDLTNPAIGISSDIGFDPSLIDADIAFLEMDYKNDINFFVGIIREENGNVFPEFKIELRPQEDWNKIYLDFSNELAPASLLSYRVIIVSEIIENEQDSASIFIDNLRLIHR